MLTKLQSINILNGIVFATIILSKIFSDKANSYWQNTDKNAGKCLNNYEEST